MRLLGAAAFAGLLFTPSAFGWGCDGHQIIALIARAHLTPGAAAAADQLLRAFPIDPDLRRFCRNKPDDPIADAATWADDARNGNKTFPWHYVDIPLSVSSGDAMKWCPPIGPSVDGKDRPGCLINALDMEWTILKDKSQPPATRAEALRYVIHFTGDITQPLHDENNNDQGGNCAEVRFFEDDRPSNLHSVWDTRLIQHDMDVRHLTTAGYAQMLDAKFGAEWPVWSKEKLDFIAWAWEGQAIARDAYARLTPPIPPEVPDSTPNCDTERAKTGALHIAVGEPYYTQSMPVIDQQLARAGYRLAAMLNQAFQ